MKSGYDDGINRAKTEDLCQLLRRGDIEAETGRALGACCDFEATVSVGIAGEMVGEADEDVQ